MKMHHYLVMLLLIVGVLYVYHNLVANKGNVRGALAGLGINR